MTIKLHEYQARELFQAYGIDVPWAKLTKSPQQAAEAMVSLGSTVMIKGQVLAGGRGKAGAIRKVGSHDAAQAAVKEILALTVKGYPVQKVLVTECIDIKKEYYLGITIDRDQEAVVLILSAAGGVDIEEIATNKPDKIRRLGLSKAISTEDLKQWLSQSFTDSVLLDEALSIVQNLTRLFWEKDCSLVEINPLAVMAQGHLIAADAKIVLDDNGLFLHPELAKLRNSEEYTQDEIDAKASDLSFVSLSGEIGCMVNGAGLAMATMDGIKLAGGRAANFLDVGGSSNPQKILDAMRILLRNKALKVILINIFGGITRCDDVAQGILRAKDQLDLEVPMVIRLVGTNEQAGRDLLSQAGLIATDSMTSAVSDAVRCAKEGDDS